MVGGDRLHNFAPVSIYQFHKWNHDSRADKGVYTSEGDSERVLKLANAAAVHDTQKSGELKALVADVRKPTDN
jgi:hypothetical protein